MRCQVPLSIGYEPKGEQTSSSVDDQHKIPTVVDESSFLDDEVKQSAHLENNNDTASRRCAQVKHHATRAWSLAAAWRLLSSIYLRLKRRWSLSAIWRLLSTIYRHLRPKQAPSLALYCIQSLLSGSPITCKVAILLAYLYNRIYKSSSDSHLPIASIVIHICRWLYSDFTIWVSWQLYFCTSVLYHYNPILLLY